MSKHELRRRMKSVLSRIPDTFIKDQSHDVFKNVVNLPQINSLKNISIFISMPKGEIDTHELISYFFNKVEDSRVFIPRCSATSMQMINIESLEQLSRLKKNSWGIPEPDFAPDYCIAYSKGENDHLDAIFMPGVCFNAEGWRLGHGKGYYDRYLANIHDIAKAKNIKMPLTVALCLEEQMIDEEIPHDHFDVKPDLIVTPSKVIKTDMFNEDIVLTNF